MPHVSIAIDSEFQSLIPPLSDDEYERLEKSILAEGVRNPIVTWNGTIIDGHNRYRICDEHGIECPHVEREFESRDAAKIWIIENQFGRRNLSKYDRSVLALQLEPLYAAEAKRKQTASLRRGSESPVSQKSDERETPIRTDEQLAKLAGTSRDTIRKVKVIEREAEGGNETAIEAREAVRSGERSINAAYAGIRPKVCTICGKPIQEGDAYERDAYKHRACANRYHDLHRARNVGKFTDDGRRICSLCGEPIDEGDAYDHHPHLHKACFNKNTNDARRRRIESQNITIGDVNEVIEHDKAELKRQLMFDVNSAWSNLQATLDRYESMGVTVTDSESSRIRDAIEPLVSAIQGISEE